MPSIAYYDGKLLPISETRIPLTNRAIFFGDAIYDAAIGRNGRIFLEAEHVDRFFQSAKLSGLSVPYERAELFELLERAVAFSALSEYFVYFQLSAIAEHRTHARAGSGASLLITVTPYSLPPVDSIIHLITFPDKRYDYCNIKAVNLLPAVFASCAAEASGAGEAVLHRGDTVTECAHSNVFILKGGELITHPKSERILSGISRGHMLRLAERLDIPAVERTFTLSELFSADEILITSTSKLCQRATRINGKGAGGKDEATALRLIHAMRYEYFRATAT